MKLLVFAHVPPPHHGQAVMVELMLRGLRGKQPRIARSSRIEGKGRDVRPARPGNVDEWPQRGAEDADGDECRGTGVEEGEDLRFKFKIQDLRRDETTLDPDQNLAISGEEVGQTRRCPSKEDLPLSTLDSRPSTHNSITVFHIDARFSTGIEDIGRGGVRKVLLLAKYALQLVWFAVFKRPDVVYFVPSPGKKVAIVRDWVLIGLCRLLGMPRMFHWHAGGLSGWVEESASGWQKSLSMWVYGNAALSIIPVESERSNAAYFHPQRIVKIPNGIPDPCPDFSTSVLPQRVARLKARRTGDAHIIRVLFMGHLHGGQGAL